MFNFVSCVFVSLFGKWINWYKIGLCYVSKSLSSLLSMNVLHELHSSASVREPATCLSFSFQDIASTEQPDAPTLPLQSDLGPRFEVKGMTFPSAPPLGSDSACEVYTSEKLNFLWKSWSWKVQYTHTYKFSSVWHKRRSLTCFYTVISAGFLTTSVVTFIALNKHVN